MIPAHLLPAFSHFFNLHAPGIYDLTDEELEPYLDELLVIAAKLAEDG